MNYDTAGADTPATEAAQAEVLVGTPEATAGQQSEADTGEASVTDETGEKSGDDAAAKPKKKPWANQRIDELTRQRREAERQAEYWKAKVAEQVNYSDLEYEEEVAARASTRNRRDMADSAEHAAQNAARQVFDVREAEARERFSDYDAVTRNTGLAISNDMMAVILESDNGPEVAYHLGKNPAEAARIAQLSPRLQAVEMGKIEARISVPRSSPKQPPTPIKPVSGIAVGGSQNPESMSMTEYAEWRKANK